MKLLIALALIAGSLALNAETFDSPVGKWRTIDDSTHEVKSIVEITAQPDGKLGGVVSRVFPKPGKEANPKCAKCQGDKKDQPVIGMKIMWDLEKDGSKWTGGKIMDPDNGKTYSCKLKLDDNGNKLEVRGFLGISLLGRKQVWEREMEPKAEVKPESKVKSR